MNPEMTGCFASRHWHKQRNRIAEHRLVAAEALGVLAGLQGFKPEHEELQKAWESLLLAQHHDGENVATVVHELSNGHIPLAQSLAIIGCRKVMEDIQFEEAAVWI